MSSESDSSEVILISTETNNQDGTHTYYILDPCPHEESVEESKIELIDLTAEVTNTGTIAVLSTNSSGAWEINLTKEADQMDESNVVHSDSAVSALSMEEISDDDMEQLIVKEEEEDVDVEEVSQADVYVESHGEMKDEGESMCFQEVSGEMDSENSHIEVTNQEEDEQDDELEEGTLYIDDVRYLGLQENIQNNTKLAERSENNREADEMIINNVKNMIEQADFVIKETESSMREEQESRENQITIIQNCAGENYSSQEGVIRNLHFEVPSRLQEVTDVEFVDSTNTALTLLELAGGSYRKTVDGVEMEVIPLENQETTDDPLDTSQEEHLTMLTTLQPVPMETPESPETGKVVPELSSEQKTDKPDIAAPTQVVRPRTNMKMEDAQTQIARLKEGDFPYMRAANRSFRGYSSPIVTQKEIAEKLIERTKSKVPYSEPKDIFFTMKIAHRLANRIVPVEKGESENSCSDRGTIDQESSVDGQHLSTPLSRKGSISYSEDRSVTPSQERSTISDKYELLKILEDDPDDPDGIPDIEESKLLINTTKFSKRSKTKFSPLIKLHPELEKKLALKQLEDFDSSRSGRKCIDSHKEKEAIHNHREHNNNTNRKRRSVDTVTKTKKIKMEVEGSAEDSSVAVTVDPRLVTETLAVEGQDTIFDQTKDSKSLKQYSNKRLSRNSESPPLEIPMEILLNGVEEDVDDNNKVKNKIFKATNPRKRQEELKKKKQTHFANVLQRNKPQKKRGRPPKKKIAPVDDSFNDDLIIHPEKKEKLKNGENKEESENSVSKENESPKDEKLQKPKKMTEIEKLLGDEGAINMLYSVEQKRVVGNEPKRGILPSYRRKKKDLMLKTKLVKSAVLRLSASPSQNEGRISLRERSTKEDNEEAQEETAVRKISVDSHDSHHSANSGNAEVFPFPAKIVPAEASRIIRRHSSSSNYSSRSNSPRRQSVDGGEQPSVLSPAPCDLGQADAALSSAQKHKVTKSSHQQVEGTYLKRLSKDKHPNSPKGIVLHTPTTTEKTKQKEQSGKTRGRPRKVLTEDEMRKRSDLETSLSAAINDFTKEIEGVDGNTATPKKPDIPDTSRTGTASKVINKVYKRASEGPGRGRPKGSVVYKELSLKRHGPLVEITLAPVSTQLKNALNASVLRELTSVLSGLTKDENCRAVLFTSTGSVFCQGVDFFGLIQDSPEKRKAVALQTAIAVKDFIKALALFSKPVMAGVQGPTVGLGVTMLPLCDLVYCSDKATFHTPYARLGQVPEGASTLTLPSVLGNSMTSELLFSCRKLTSAEAISLGLVTRILDSDDFYNHLIPIVTAVANQSSQAMDATKALLRHNLLSGLETTLISETHLLIQHWVSEECQRNFALYLRDDEHTLELQKQPT